MASISKTATSTGATRWRARWRDPGGRPREKWFRRKVDAERFVAEMTLGHRHGGQERVGQLLTQWLASNGPRLAPKTVAAYDSLARMITKSLGAVRVDALTARQVQQAVGAWQTAGLSASRIAGAVGLLGQALDAAEVVRNPVRSVKLPTGRSTPRRSLSPAEADAAVARLPERERLLGEFLNVTGCRWAEAVGLTRGQVDLERARVLIDRSLSQVNGRLHERPTKTGRSRTVPLPPDLADSLLRATEGRLSEDLVFTAPAGGPVRYDVWIRAHWTPLGLGVGIHALRGAAITRLLERGVPPHVVMAVVGHADPRLTMAIYASVNEDALGKVWG